ncbi:MAG: ferritin-like domain-containing protein [Qipengyuania sp.]
MKNEHKLIDAMVARANRRAFLRTSGGAAAAVAGATLLSGCFEGENRPRNPPIGGGPTPTPTTAIGDADILNFALNLEYLEAQFYFQAAFGEGLPANILGGVGTQGGVTGGRKVNFTDPLIAQYAREIARDEIAHVRFLRTALGSAAVAQPPIDISSGPNGPFSAAARAAGLIGAGQSFDPYASDENFLLGAYIFEDVGVTAYKGASPLITNKTFLEAAAGILAAEAYHASLVRTVLFGKGISTPAPALIDATEKISDARDSLDGPADLDQGVAIRNNGANIVPTDGNGLVFSRTGPQVLNIVFLTRMAAQQGGFFPRGVNGSINTSSSA